MPSTDIAMELEAADELPLICPGVSKCLEIGLGAGESAREGFRV